MIMGLTASQIKFFHGKDQEKNEKPDRDSLSIIVSNKGKLSFYFPFRYCDRQQRMCLGQYLILSLSEARDKVLELKSYK